MRLLAKAGAEATVSATASAAVKVRKVWFAFMFVSYGWVWLGASIASDDVIRPFRKSWVSCKIEMYPSKKWKNGNPHGSSRSHVNRAGGRGGRQPVGGGTGAENAARDREPQGVRARSAPANKAV